MELSNLKLWWVYAGDQYYPQSALGDLQGTFYTEVDADEFAATFASTQDWVKVVYVGDKIGAVEHDRWQSSGAYC